MFCMTAAIKKIDVNAFWTKTPTPLKYILILALFVATTYFIFSNNINNKKFDDIDQMKNGINATYELINNFESYRKEQDEYNKQVLSYLKNLHNLIEELNETTNKKFDLTIKTDKKEAVELLDKMIMLNESFEKISTIYRQDTPVLPVSVYKEYKPIAEK